MRHSAGSPHRKQVKSTGKRPQTTRSKTLAQFDAALDADELVPLHKPQVVKSSLGHSLASTQARQKTSTRVQSLSTTCAQFLAQHVDSLPVEQLALLGWSLGALIWRKIDNSLLDSLEVVLKFASIYPELKQHKRINVSLNDLSSLLSRIICSPYNTVTSHWLTSLDLSSLPIPVDLLLQLGTIHSLSVLLVSDAGLKDDTINHWCRSRAIGRFSRLRLLDISMNSGIKNTESALRKLTEFDSLQLVKCSQQNSNILDQEQLEARWNVLSKPDCTTIDIVAHLGSRGDGRPVPDRSATSIIDMVELRQSACDQVIATARSRKRKSSKAMTDVWSAIL